MSYICSKEVIEDEDAGKCIIFIYILMMFYAMLHSGFQFGKAQRSTPAEFEAYRQEMLMQEFETLEP